MIECRQHVPTDNRPPPGKPERCRNCAAVMETCPASREAVEEQEEYGEVGCPLCGCDVTAHPSEDL